MFGYLGQRQSQGERSHQQQMGLDPHHGPVGASNRVDQLVGVQVLLGLDAETAHGVDHRLCTTARDGGDTVSGANKSKALGREPWQAPTPPPSLALAREDIKHFGSGGDVLQNCADKRIGAKRVRTETDKKKIKSIRRDERRYRPPAPMQGGVGSAVLDGERQGAALRWPRWHLIDFFFLASCRKRLP